MRECDLFCGVVRGPDERPYCNANATGSRILCICWCGVLYLCAVVSFGVKNISRWHGWFAFYAHPTHAQQLLILVASGYGLSPDSTQYEKSCSGQMKKKDTIYRLASLNFQTQGSSTDPTGLSFYSFTVSCALFLYRLILNVLYYENHAFLYLHLESCLKYIQLIWSSKTKQYLEKDRNIKICEPFYEA